MKEKTVYEAEDGTRFEEKSDCANYEAGPMISAMLIKLIEDKCGEEHNDDAGFAIIHPHNVRDFIMSNFEEIERIVKLNQVRDAAT